MDKLKPCPFCGGTKLKVERKSKSVGWTGLDVPVDNMTYSVRCNKCHARGPARGGKVLRYTIGVLPLPDWSKEQSKLYEEAVKAWNRRASDA